MQDSLPAGGLRLCRAGVEPAGSLREVSAHVILLSRAYPGATSVPDAIAVQHHAPLWTISTSPCRIRPDSVEPFRQPVLDRTNGAGQCHTSHRSVAWAQPTQRLAGRRLHGLTERFHPPSGAVSDDTQPEAAADRSRSPCPEGPMPGRSCMQGTSFCGKQRRKTPPALLP